MEELNKTQIVLLTIFVTFVTSIATGIVTVTLLSKAPQSVTNVIDHVVEKTIEKVVPASSTGQSATVVRESVKIISSEDMVVAAIERNRGSIFAIYGIPVGASESSEVTFYGLGFVVSKDGVLVSDISAVQEGVSYRADNAGGKSVKISLVKTDPKRSLAYFKIVLDDKSKLDLIPVTLGDVNILKIGQNVVAMGGKERSAVSIGIISSLDREKIGTTTATSIRILYTTTDLKPLYTGSLLINSGGEVVGFYRYFGEYGNYVPLPGLKEMSAVFNEVLSAPPVSNAKVN